LRFGAAAHEATVLVNGKEAGKHCGGYTAFEVELTPHLRFGEENLVAVRLDSRETLDQPPFGFVIDYLTYGGLYRAVDLIARERAFLRDLFLMPKPEGSSGKLDTEVSLVSPEGDYTVRQTVFSPDGEQVSLLEKEFSVPEGGQTLTLSQSFSPVRKWDTEDPNLYTVRTELSSGEDVLDVIEERVGFRTAVFKKDGFYLNGRKTLIRGLNRHQSYPYVGYAMPDSMQRLDADILKNELCVNAVRTSHYPQSPAFVDRCDENGLLVFTEIPGWQHIGESGEWKEKALTAVSEMIRQYRNHPSVILWGVRINESRDDDELYEKTNRLAHELDGTRQTGGVRYLKKSHLLEDVYTYNDFVHDGTNRGVDKKKDVSPDLEKPYLVTEYGGHMFPTKMYDPELHMLSHLLRHAKVMSDVALSEGISGSFGWCLFDYNTHGDFGSGDRVCYHGVTDMFRNPKPVSSLYAAQEDRAPVLEVTSHMDIGEHPAGMPGTVYLVSNADTVRMYRSGRLLKEYDTTKSAYPGLKHGPVLIDDYVGDRLEKDEGFPKKKSELCKAILNHSALYGNNDLPPRILAKAARAMVQYGLSFADAYDLYGRYVGCWGEKAISYRFEAVKDGRVVAVREFRPDTNVSLKILVDHSDLCENGTYDVASVRISAVDGDGNLLRFFQEPLRFSVTGPLSVIGPENVTLSGGCGGTYVKTEGKPGEGQLVIRSERLGEVTLPFTITIQNQEETL
ncbi:MAG: glycoside hydrolase family 2 protein, partial [Clostridia bacterium]|nr:glycoside hydrolase family 2 protein [Clostridia bacterium]